MRVSAGAWDQESIIPLVRESGEHQSDAESREAGLHGPVTSSETFFLAMLDLQSISTFKRAARGGFSA